MLARNMGVKITISGKDVTKDLSLYLRGITYEDKLSGEADTVSLELMDKARLFIGDWFPKRGDAIDVVLIRECW